MQIFKFRIWNPISRDFIYSGETPMELSDFFKETALSNILHNIPYELYSFVKDKNGKEIYEGDTYRVLNSIDGSPLGDYYDKKGGKTFFRAKDSVFKETTTQVKFITNGSMGNNIGLFISCISTSRIEVVGNIHANTH